MSKKASCIKALFILLIIMFIVNISSPIYATELGKNRTIRVGYIKNYGIVADQPDSQKTGYIHDYLSEISMYTGWEYEYVPCDWATGMTMLQNGEIDLFGPMQKNEEREAILDYPNREMGVEYCDLYIHKDNKDIYYEDIENFNGMRIGTEKGVSFNERLDEYCQKNNIDVTYIYTDPELWGEGLATKKFDAVLSGSMMDIPNTNVVAKISSDPYYFPTTKGNSEVLDGLNMAIDNILNKDAYFAERLNQKYYGTKQSTLSPFTKEEAQFIKDNPKLNVVIDSNSAPIEYLDKKSKTYKGINVEVLKEISNVSGLEFNLLPAKDYEQSKEIFKNGQADLIMGFAEQDDEFDRRSSIPFLQVPTMFISHKNVDTNHIPSVAISNFTSKTALDVMERFPQFEYIDYGSRSNVLESLRYNKEDFAFINSYAFDEIARQESIVDYTTIFTDITFPLNISVSNSMNSIVLSILNKSIKKIAPEQIDSIVFANTVQRAHDIPFSITLKQNALLIIAFVIIFFALIVLLIIYNNRRTKEKLKTLAYVDSLTGVSTLAKFYIDAEQALKMAKPSEYMLIHLDINNFKYINNSYGYDIGDKVLIAIMEHFKEIKDKNDLLARISADNFVIFTKALSSEELLERFDVMCSVDDHIVNILPKRYRLIFSIGTYIVADTNMETSSILDKANIARKSVKGSHSNRITEYTEDMDRQVEWEKEVTLSMQNALDNNEFEVYLQPKYQLKDEQIISAEALVRWNHPQKGLLPPGMFISLFEQNGFIQKVDFFVFEQVCILISKWSEFDLDIPPISISVNLSRMHLNNSHLVEDLLALTKKYNVSPNTIEIELTESIVFLNSDLLIRIMKKLKSAGFQISIDDFGSGYSSLNLLKDLPVDILKIDKAFLDEATDTNKGQSIIASIIEMTKKLNLTTVAEGVETKEQMILLLNMGCDIAQGYYYAKPMPINEFKKRYAKKEIFSFS
ncbi:MAG: EAL domain-containing protein [Oscillospiraceae bacterium]